MDNDIWSNNTSLTKISLKLLILGNTRSANLKMYRMQIFTRFFYPLTEIRSEYPVPIVIL